jgi:hypothetical protein
MNFGWKALLPIALANFVVTGAAIILVEENVLSIEGMLGLFSG